MKIQGNEERFRKQMCRSWGMGIYPTDFDQGDGLCNHPRYIDKSLQIFSQNQQILLLNWLIFNDFSKVLFKKSSQKTKYWSVRTGPNSVLQLCLKVFTKLCDSNFKNNFFHLLRRAHPLRHPSAQLPLTCRQIIPNMPNVENRFTLCVQQIIIKFVSNK